MDIEDIKNTIIQGDCIEEMRKFPDNSIDSIICDPPYALGFMGKDWDIKKDYQHWTTQWAKEALRIAKPGATMLVFGGTRTWHRLACGLEDAGWVIKDTLMWLYGSGFPKATDISKQIDKKFGVEYPKNVPISENRAMSGANYTRNKMPVQTPEAKLWNGWKSHGLKPAYEPIIMAMKPNEGSYANNALKWGVAGLNIDAGRIGTNEVLSAEYGHPSGSKIYNWNKDKKEMINRGRINTKGRFPANILLDEESAKLLDQQSGVRKVGWSNKDVVKKDSKNPIYYGGAIKGQTGSHFNDKGGASRFFYVAKASKRERNMGCEDLPIKQTIGGGGINNTEDDVCGKYGSIKASGHNNHPTVKPLKLMEYLVKLTSMPNKDQIYLDPFLGSGTTAIACKSLGKNWIGIEKEEEYIKIAQARIKATQKPLF